MAMLGDIVELSVVVGDLDAAAARFTQLFGLSVHRRDTSERFGFKNAILPTGIGHIELLQPTDPDKAVGRFLAKRGEGVYLVGFECADVAGSSGAPPTSTPSTRRPAGSRGSYASRSPATCRKPPPSRSSRLSPCSSASRSRVPDTASFMTTLVNGSSPSTSRRVRAPAGMMRSVRTPPPLTSATSV